MSSLVISGARGIFKLNGTKIAFASNIDVNEEVSHEPVDVLDNIMTQENVPVGYRVSFTCGVFRTIPGAPLVVEPTPLAEPRQGAHGSPKALGLFPKVKDILTMGVLSCTLTDRITQKTIMNLHEARAATLNWSMTARGIVAQNITFVAIQITDETESAL